jgi:fatty-acyl-CoA synthase
MNDPTPAFSIEGLTIGQALARTAALHPTQDALLCPAAGVECDWREFLERVDQAAHGLLALGIRRGDHVALWATNVPEWVFLQFATARIGAVLVTVNPAYRPFELSYVLEQSDAVALVLIDRWKTSDYYAMLTEVAPQLDDAEPGQWQVPSFPKLRNVVTLRGTGPRGSMSWERLLELGRGDRTDLDRLGELLSPRDPINIQYTSGTTGFPKAATLSHHNLLANAYWVGACQRMTERDRICLPLPFYHCFGCVLGTLCAAVYGAAMIVPAESFNPTATLDAIERYGATVIYGVPTMYIAQLQDPSFPARRITTLRTGIMSGSPCPIEVMRQVVGAMGVREMTNAYGQTEASPVITQTRCDDPIELRVETVGRPLPGVEVKLVDPATGATLGDNQQGELCTRGHVVMLGYYRNPQATAAAIDADGWLHTGDIALRLASGYYRITGRIKDLVIRGGENIYPREVEEFLFTHPAIEQVSVVGVPDLKYGEELCAWIKLKAGARLAEDEVREFCKAKLARFKVPRYVRFVEAFPQTVTGKIQKFKIREQMISDLNLAQQETA